MNTPSEWRATDLQDFMLTKAAREISDYQIFLDAYRDWYGHDPAENRLESRFGDYLNTGDLPHFVRQYARRYVATHPGPVQTLLDRERRDKWARLIVYGVLAAMVFFAMVII